MACYVFHRCGGVSERRAEEGTVFHCKGSLYVMNCSSGFRV